MGKSVRIPGKKKKNSAAAVSAKNRKGQSSGSMGSTSGKTPSSMKLRIGGEDVKKPKRRKARVERILKKKQPQLKEGAKRVLFLKGNKSSQVVNDVLGDMAMMTKPNNCILNRKNEILPFEEIESLEFLCEKNECSLFVLGTSSKKRPDNIVVGRMFDGKLLDMFEFGISAFQALQDFTGDKKMIGSKPLVLFLGDQWEVDAKYTAMQNILLDLVKGERSEKVALSGLDHCISFSLVADQIRMRAYSMVLLKSGTKDPFVDLQPMGPNFDLTPRRSQRASDDSMLKALKMPKQVTEKKVKNIKYDEIEGKIGRIHMVKQDLDKFSHRRVTALRKGHRELVDVDADFGAATRAS